MIAMARPINAPNKAVTAIIGKAIAMQIMPSNPNINSKPVKAAMTITH
jgi:hypothetical protein